MLKNFMDDLEKSAQKLKDAVMSPDTKAKLEEAARVAGEGVAEAVKFVKETAETIKPAAESAAQTVTKAAEDIAQAAREGYESKAGPAAAAPTAAQSANPSAAEPSAQAHTHADGQTHAHADGQSAHAHASADSADSAEAAAAKAKASADDLARAAGEGIASLVKMFQGAIEKSRPGAEAFSQTMDDLMKAAQKGYERKMEEGAPAAPAAPAASGPKM